MGMTIDDKLYQAEEFGKHAAASGKIRAFSLDRRANRLESGNDGIAIEIAKAWYRGWDTQDAKQEAGG